MRRLRSSTVEPVLGILINFLGMKKVNTRGIAQAEKHVLMAALCYNLKKLLKFKPKTPESITTSMQKANLLVEKLFLRFLGLPRLVFNPNNHLSFQLEIVCKKIRLA
jgi:hypothetical protein